ncbi:ABC transporter ATP-binding protein [Cellulosilyticum ruminicola]|uniref:ABC transporter ATP-binding protein n=1 Tax=Cellulosilyticum ruminicola TaxID=425254 RepID=UPI0006CFCB88|nr:ABC transporter ATP-binding protein [Cellulosilyticum ruminicola]
MEACPIKVDNIKKAFNGRQILKGVSFEVQKGDIFGFLGPNGAGKTTTIRTLLGLYQADSGKATILGYDAGSDMARKNVGFVLDGDGLYDTMTAAENLAYFLKIYEKPVSRTKIENTLQLVGLKDRADDKAGTFSKGMRQRLALARALVYDPAVLILDEPTSGVDPSAQLDIRAILMDIVHKYNKTILLSSHNMDEVQKICNRVALLNKGEIKLYGKLEELRKQKGKNIIITQTSQYVSDEILNKLKKIPNLGFKAKEEEGLVFAPTGEAKISEIINILSKEGIEVENVIKNEASLEDMYTSIVRNTK